MKKEKTKKHNLKMICPEIFYDIEDIVEILQEKEISILVNLKYYTEKESINKIIHFISSCQTSYATLRVKKFSSKAFICWSEHEETQF